MISLDEIEARVTAATPGPWKWDKKRIFGGARLVAKNFDTPLGWHSDLEIEERDEKRQVWATRIIETDSGHYPPREADAVFIANARADVPALLSCIRKLKATVKELESAIEFARFKR